MLLIKSNNLSSKKILKKSYLLQLCCVDCMNNKFIILEVVFIDSAKQPITVQCHNILWGLLLVHSRLMHLKSDISGEPISNVVIIFSLVTWHVNIVWVHIHLLLIFPANLGLPVIGTWCTVCLRKKHPSTNDVTSSYKLFWKKIVCICIYMPQVSDIPGQNGAHLIGYFWSYAFKCKHCCKTNFTTYD